MVKQEHPLGPNAEEQRVFPKPRNPGQVISPFFTWIPTTVRRKGGVQNPHGEVRGDRLEREARDLFPRRPGPNVKHAMRNSWQASTQGKDVHADGSVYSRGRQDP